VSRGTALLLPSTESLDPVPRRLVSPVALPGNDFYLFDRDLAVFFLYAGNGMPTAAIGCRAEPRTQIQRQATGYARDEGRR
jgi:hypothetical protein